MRTLARGAGICAQPDFSFAARAEDPESTDKLSVENLIKDGWQIAGYTGADGWSAFILLRHPNHSHLAQCRGYDVLCQKRVTISCDKLRQRFPASRIYANLRPDIASGSPPLQTPVKVL